MQSAKVTCSCVCWRERLIKIVLLCSYCGQIICSGWHVRGLQDHWLFNWFEFFRFYWLTLQVSTYFPDVNHIWWRDRRIFTRWSWSSVTTRPILLDLYVQGQVRLLNTFLNLKKTYLKDGLLDSYLWSGCWSCLSCGAWILITNLMELDCPRMWGLVVLTSAPEDAWKVCSKDSLRVREYGKTAIGLLPINSWGVPAQRRCSVFKRCYYLL